MSKTAIKLFGLNTATGDLAGMPIHKTKPRTCNVYFVRFYD